MKAITIILLSVLSFTILSCGTTPTKSNTNISILNGVWNLQNNGKTTIGIGNNPITLVFDPTSNKDISGFSGCNNYGGSYVRNNGFISFKDIYTTKMACPNLDEEEDYIKLLKLVNRFESTKSDLYLYKNKILLLHFKKY